MKFTDAQREAIHYQGGHLQILACAGSGKTEVVARRVASLLDPSRPEPLRPANIVAFTFTERGAAELKGRIARRVREAHGEMRGLAEMFVGTIHAFCGRLLKDEVPTYLRYEVLDEARQQLLVLRDLAASGFDAVRTRDGESLRAPDDLRRYLAALDVLRQAEVDHLQLGDSPIAVALDRYRALLREASFIDYTGQLEAALDVLRRDVDVGLRLSARVRHVIVDEYQDTNALQEQVVQALAGFGATLTVVGDDDQTIFQWNGADVQNILGFAARYPDVRQVRLEDNFRSSAPIVEFARDFIAPLERRLPKAMKSTDAHPHEHGDVAAVGFSSEWEEARYVAARMRELHGAAFDDGGQTRGLTWSDMAVLFRGSIQWAGKALLRVLDEQGIPFVVTGVKSLFDRPEVTAACAIFSALRATAPPASAALSTAWGRANAGVSAAGVAALVRLLDARRAGLREVPSDDRSAWAPLGLQRLFLESLDVLGVREGVTPEEVLFNLGRFSDVLGDFESIHAQQGPAERVEAFWHYANGAAKKAHEEGMQNSAFASLDAVRVTTVHRAKGLQWPAVFLPALGEGRFPSHPREAELWRIIPRDAIRSPERYEDCEDDERRLFYVAVTRAQRYLVATWARGSRSPRAGAYFTALASRPGVATREVSFRQRPRAAPRPRPGATDLRLNFSVIKPMLECPARFKLQGVYGFKAPLEEAEGVGRCLHDALADVHRRAIEGGAVDVSLVPRLLQRYLNLPYAAPETVGRLRERCGDILTRYLTHHRGRLAQVALREKPVEVSMDDDVVVDGRVDLVVRSDEGDAAIVDLKSNRRAQSEALNETQLGLYALGYEALTGTLPARVEVWELDQLRAHATPVDEALLARMRAVVSDVARRIRTRSFDPAPDGARCARCPVRGLCPDRAPEVSPEGPPEPPRDP